MSYQKDMFYVLLMYMDRKVQRKSLHLWRKSITKNGKSVKRVGYEPISHGMLWRRNLQSWTLFMDESPMEKKITLSRDSLKKLSIWMIWILREGSQSLLWQRRKPRSTNALCLKPTFGKAWPVFLGICTANTVVGAYVTACTVCCAFQQHLHLRYVNNVVRTMN